MLMTKRIGLSSAALVAVALLVSPPSLHADSPTSTSTLRFADTISLPNGFRPEGVVIGRGTTIYAGSIPTGAIFAADLRTGQGSILVPPQPGRAAIGLDFDRRTNLLYVAGGPTGAAFVYDADTGDTVAVFQLTTEATTFINDQIVVRDAVYFTDSMRPVMYRIPLSRRGELSPDAMPVEIPLGGEFTFVPGQFNANGIEATPGGKDLILVNSFVGTLYRVDPDTGFATTIDLGGDSVVNGDGIFLRGDDLFVVQNQLNQIVRVDLDRQVDSGVIEQVITDSRFDIPTTLDGLGGSLYVVNARFNTPPTPDTTYTIVRVPRGRGDD
jgi:sugar lactone lactonase YvrE